MLSIFVPKPSLMFSYTRSRPHHVWVSLYLQTLPALARLQVLRRGNARLLVENKAMLRTLARLSQTASLPETEDL